MEDEKRMEKLLSKLLDLSGDDFQKLEMVLFPDPEASSGPVEEINETAEYRQISKAKGNGADAPKGNGKRKTPTGAANQFFAAQAEAEDTGSGMFSGGLDSFRSDNPLVGESLERPLLSVDDQRHALIPVDKSDHLPAATTTMMGTAFAYETEDDPPPSADDVLLPEDEEKILIGQSFDDMMSPFLVSEEQFKTSVASLQEQGSKEGAPGSSTSHELLPFEPISLIDDDEPLQSLPVLSDGKSGAMPRIEVSQEQGAFNHQTQNKPGSLEDVEKAASSSVFQGRPSMRPRTNPLSFDEIESAPEPDVLTFRRTDGSSASRQRPDNATPLPRSRPDNVAPARQRPDNATPLPRSSASQGRGMASPQRTASSAHHKSSPAVASPRQPGPDIRRSQEMMPVTRIPGLPDEPLSQSQSSFTSPYYSQPQATRPKQPSTLNSPAFAEPGVLGSQDADRLLGEPFESMHPSRSAMSTGHGYAEPFQPKAHMHSQGHAEPFQPKTHNPLSHSQGHASHTGSQTGLPAHSMASQSLMTGHLGPSQASGGGMTGPYPVVHTGMYQIVDGVPQPIYTTTGPGGITNQWTATGPTPPNQMTRLLLIAMGTVLFFFVTLGVVWMVWFSGSFSDWRQQMQRAQMQPRAATLRTKVTLTSTPKGASISLGEDSIGKQTPTTLRLKPGKYVFVLHKKGFQKKTIRVRILAGQRKLEFQAELKPKQSNRSHGMLYVTSTSKGFQIWINGKKTEHLAPKMIQLEAGRYAVYVRKARYRSEIKSVELAKGQFLHVHLSKRKRVKRRR